MISHFKRIILKIHVICVGKTDEKYLQEGISKYEGRLKHYVSFRMTVLPDVKHVKGMSADEQKEREGRAIEKVLSPADVVVLLDEKGSALNSVAFSSYLEKQALASVKQLVFIIGGPYGFAAPLYARAQWQISLSEMTFSHQMVRLFFMEQLYRAYTIQRGEPYHHV